MGSPDPHSLRGKQTFHKSQPSTGEDPLRPVIRNRFKKEPPGPRAIYYGPGRTPKDCLEGNTSHVEPSVPAPTSNTRGTGRKRSGGHLAAGDCDRPRDKDQGSSSSAKNRPKIKRGKKNQAAVSDQVDADTAWMREKQGEHWTIE